MNRINIAHYILALVLVLIDTLALFFTLDLAMAIRQSYFQEYLPLFNSADISKYYWIVVITILTLIVEKIYFIRHDFWGDLKRIYKALFFSFLAVFTVITLTKMSGEYSRIFILLFFLLALFILPFFKRYSKKILFSLQIFKISIFVLAKDEALATLLQEIRDNWYLGFYPSKKDFSIVLINSKSFTTTELERLIQTYAQKTRDLYVVPYMSHIDFSHTTIMDYSNIKVSAIHLENRLLNYKNIFIKYFFEKILTILVLPLALVLHIFITIAIKLNSSGPVIFKQKRLGKGSRVFHCYKYRTMYMQNSAMLEEYLHENPDEVQHYATYHKYKNDPRITRVGHFLRQTSLDEFPQFYNILQGKMNLIGPRPYMLSEKKKIGNSYQEIILKVKPGITGLWQVSGRNELSFKERVTLDSWYIQNWSLWGDFVILIKTVKVVFFKVGVK